MCVTVAVASIFKYLGFQTGHRGIPTKLFNPTLLVNECSGACVCCLCIFSIPYKVSLQRGWDALDCRMLPPHRVEVSVIQVMETKCWHKSALVYNLVLLGCSHTNNLLKISNMCVNSIEYRIDWVCSSNYMK